MAFTTYPLNNVEYSAEDAELFHCTRSSGIWEENDFDITVTGDDATCTIGEGLGWIRNSKYSGKVFACKEETVLEFGLADAIYPRIDAVVIQFDINANDTTLMIKEGTPSSNPVPPEVIQTESIYELHLYHVNRNAGAVNVSVADVTDVRADDRYCGYMSDSVSSVARLERMLGNLSDLTTNDKSNLVNAVNEVAERDAYSSDEQRIGTWIDGKPLYRKCFTYNSDVSANTAAYIGDISALNIQNVVRLGGVQQAGGGIYRCIPYVFNMGDTSTSEYIGLWVQSEKIQLKTNFGLSNSNIIVTIEYTKTTD